MVTVTPFLSSKGIEEAEEEDDDDESEEEVEEYTDA